MKEKTYKKKTKDKMKEMKSCKKKEDTTIK